MDKFDFITRLKAALSALSPDESDAALEYYKELFEEAGSENERALIASLESPETIAETIIRENGMISVTKNKNKDDFTEKIKAKFPKTPASGKPSTEVVLLIIIAILTSPAWIGIVAGVFAAMFGVIVTLYCVAIVFGLLGVTGIICGAVMLFFAPASGLVTLGLGLIFSSLFTLIFIPAIKGTTRSIKWICKTIKDIWNRFFGGANINKGAIA